MSLTTTAPRPKIVERRRFSRVSVKLPGRFMLPDQSEHICVTENISPGGVLLRATKEAEVGARVVAYIDQIGRIEGTVVRTNPSGFVLTIGATIRKRDKLAAQLMWLANRHTLGLPEDRRHERVVPRNAITIMQVDGGDSHTVRLMDISLSGAAVASTLKMEMGTVVTLGSTRGRIVRPLEGGFAVEFSRPLASHDLDIDTRL
jgi:hypothetical protein